MTGTHQPGALDAPRFQPHQVPDHGGPVHLQASTTSTTSTETSASPPAPTATIKLGREVTGTVDSEADVYRLHVSTAGVLRLDFSDNGSAGLISVQIHDALGMLHPATPLGTIEHATLLPASGDYFVTVRSLKEQAQAFQFTPTLVTEKYTSYDGPGNESIATADALQLGRPIVGMVRDSFTDVYKLATGSGGQLHLSIAHPGGHGSQGSPFLLTLYDFEGKEAYKHVFLGSELRTVPVPGGTYYAQVSDLPGHDQQAGLYSLVATVTGRQDAQIFAGTPADDTLYVDEGNDTVFGDSGMDTVVFSGARADYRLTFSPAAIVASSKAEHTDTLVSVERLQFKDMVLDLGADSHAAQLYRLYQIAFGREPDATGLGFWVRTMDQGVSLHTVATEFARCGEFQQLHGARASSRELVSALYQQGLERAGDQAGMDFWSGVIDRGVPLADVLVGFSESAENQAKLVGAVSHGVEYIAFG